MVMMDRPVGASQGVMPGDLDSDDDYYGSKKAGGR